MKINERLYPHPVLAHFSDDVLSSLFQVTPKVTTGKYSYKFNVTARTSNKALRELVEQSKAQYALHIECASTRYRNVIRSNDSEFSTEIEATRLDGRVELCSLIIATQDIHEYKNANFHPDYGDATFTIKKGDVLAVGQDLNFDADKDVDPLQHISSIFKVRADKASDAPPFTVYPDESIVIYLSQQNYDSYAQLRTDNSKQVILASMIILPALIQVLEDVKAAFISGQSEGYVEKKYFRVICKKLRDMGLDPEDPTLWGVTPCIVIAQKLVGDPLTNSLKIMMAEEDSAD